MEILELSQIFARRKVHSPTFVATDFYLRQRLWVGLAVYSSGNIAFNRGTLRRDSARSLLRYPPSISFCYLTERKEDSKTNPASYRARISRASFRELQQLQGKLQGASETRVNAKFSRKAPSSCYKKA